MRQKTATRFRLGHCGTSRTIPKTLGKPPKVRFLSSPLVKPRFYTGFSHFWPIALAGSVACCFDVVVWYADLSEIPILHRGLVQCGRHLINSWHAHEDLDRPFWLMLRQPLVLGDAGLSSKKVVLIMSNDDRPQSSIRALFLLTLIVGLDAAAALSSGHWFFTPALLMNPCILISVLLMTHLGFGILAASRIGFLLFIGKCVLFGGMQSIYLLTFERDRAMASFGLGSPISAGIVSALICLPYAIICFGISSILGFAIRRFMERRTKFNSTKSDKDSR